MFERDRFEPVNADMNAVTNIAAGNYQILALGRSAANENSVVSLIEQRTHAVDPGIEAQFDIHVEYVADLLVEDFGRQAKCGDIRAHQPAGLVQRLINDTLVTERSEIVGNGQGCGSGSDQRNPFAVELRWSFGQQRGYIVTMIRGDSFETTDRNRLFLDPASPAGRLAGSITDPTENAREHV